MVEKLWGKEPSHSLLAYASADASAITGSIGREQNPAMGGSAPYDRDTAVYDITAHTVYLPDGSKLEAHSGLGDNMDDPRSQKIRMRGVTPPHIYTLKPREVAVSRRAGAAADADRRRGCDLSAATACLRIPSCWAERRFQRLRLLPRLQRLPERLSQPGHPQARRGRAGGVRGGRGARHCCEPTQIFIFEFQTAGSSLRGAERRSNPDLIRGNSLDCFASLAMTKPNHEWIRLGILAARIRARALLDPCPSEGRGRRECRALAAPAGPVG